MAKSHQVPKLTQRGHQQTPETDTSSILSLPQGHIGNNDCRTCTMASFDNVISAAHRGLSDIYLRIKPQILKRTVSATRIPFGSFFSYSFIFTVP